MSRPTLTTDRLVLRPFGLDDVPAVARLAGDRDLASTTLRIPHPYSEEDARTWIEGQETARREHARTAFAITLEATGELVGCVGIEVTRSHDQAEIGYWVGKPYWGRGYATEAVAEVIRYGFEHERLERIQAGSFARNPASARVMEKNGMQFEGTLRRAIRKWDAFEDLEIRAILREEWQRRQDLGAGV